MCPLTFIINQMLETGIFPCDLKVARVTPVYKGGAVSEISNYRPISVLPILSKVFENVINARLVNFLNKYHVVSNSQYGFQKGKSTEMALLLIKNEILKNMENKLFIVGLFIDLKKAFDCVNHNILLSKLHDYGIRGIALDLVKSYLCNRKQCVKVNDSVSPTTIVKFGVPQESILRPLLFVLYINDLCNVPDSPKMVMYADDTNIFFSAPTLRNLNTTINNYLIKLEQWLDCTS